MNGEDTPTDRLDAGAYGVNYALRPHKFVDRRVFIETLSRFSSTRPLDEYSYVGLGSFAMEDHKLINASFGIRNLLSLEVEQHVLKRQIFNNPLSCIRATLYSTSDFVTKREAILREAKIDPTKNLIVWFDMTDKQRLRTHLDTFADLLRSCTPGDVVRYTVDIDGKTLGIPNGRLKEGETLTDLNVRRFAFLREQLGHQLKPGARIRNLTPLGIARLVLFAFKVISEETFARDLNCNFLPLSLTTYADGHRMLSITGTVLRPNEIANCKRGLNLKTIPGGSESWEDLISIQIPQLTVWEKLYLDRMIYTMKPKQLAQKLDFKLHETIPTDTLLKGYETFQRFYPNFRHVTL